MALVSLFNTAWQDYALNASNKLSYTLRTKILILDI